MQEQEYQVRREKEKSAFDKWLVNKILHDDTLKILESLCNKQGSEYSAPNNITCEEVYIYIIFFILFFLFLNFML